MRRFLLVWMVSATLVVGCQRSAEDALVIGRLFGDPSIGCVWVGGPKGGLEVEWPPLYEVDLEAVLVSGPGFVAEEGDWFRMTGGTRPDVTVTPGCPVPKSQSGRFIPAAVEFFGEVEPPAT